MVGVKIGNGSETKSAELKGENWMTGNERHTVAFLLTPTPLSIYPPPCLLGNIIPSTYSFIFNRGVIHFYICTITIRKFLVQSMIHGV
jgi:hypothetical protein